MACHNKDHHHANEHNSDHEHGHHHEAHAHHGDGTANAHMHQSSVEDLIQRFESPERDAYQMPEKVLDYLGDLEGKTIIDIGAGSGYFSVKLAAKGANVIAADVDDEFQTYLAERIERDSLKNIRLRKLPYDTPALDEDEMDMVFMVNTYHHIENRKYYFEQVLHGLNYDGELVIIDFFKKETPVGPPVDHKISMDQVEKELREAGFTSFEKEVDLLPYQYIIRCK